MKDVILSIIAMVLCIIVAPIIIFKATVEYWWFFVLIGVSIACYYLAEYFIEKHGMFSVIMSLICTIVSLSPIIFIIIAITAIVIQ